MLLHITVNTLNEYHDHLTGIDHRTVKTPFNGGSGVLQNGLLSPEEVRRAAYISFASSIPISLLLVTISGPQILPIIILGMVFALFYTQVFARNLLGEVSAGLGLGALPVLGAYLVQTGSLSFDVWTIAAASAFLTFNLQLLNEFPDLDADKNGGRRNLVMVLGETVAARLYVALNVLVLGIIAGAVLIGVLPVLALIGLATIPLAYRASKTAMLYTEGHCELLEGQKANIGFILGMQTLVAIAVLVAIYHPLI